MNSHELIDIDRCFIQHDATNRVTTVVKTILQDLRIPIYHERKKTGVVRTIVARVGFYTGDVQLVIVTATKEFPRKELFVAEVKRRLPEVKSIAQNINGQKRRLFLATKRSFSQENRTFKKCLATYRLNYLPALFPAQSDSNGQAIRRSEKAAALTKTNASSMRIAASAQSGFGLPARRKKCAAWTRSLKRLTMRVKMPNVTASQTSHMRSEKRKRCCQNG